MPGLIGKYLLLTYLCGPTHFVLKFDISASLPICLWPWLLLDVTELLTFGKTRLIYICIFANSSKVRKKLITGDSCSLIHPDIYRILED